MLFFNSNIFLAKVSMCTYTIENISPSLHCYTLEHCQHSKTKVIKVCDAIIGAFPAVLLTVFPIILLTMISLPC